MKFISIILAAIILTGCAINSTVSITKERQVDRVVTVGEHQ